jgi:hypothetical protein
MGKKRSRGSGVFSPDERHAFASRNQAGGDVKRAPVFRTLRNGTLTLAFR